jgi:hypothetical protein
MTTPNPALVAAAPEFSAALSALSQFFTNLGPDPTKLPVTLPGAWNIFKGQVELQLPQLINAEWGVLVSGAQSDIANWQKQLAAQTAATPAPTAT